MAIADTLNNLLFTSTLGLFKAYGVQRAEDPAGAKETASTLAAVVGFTGAAISGAVVLVVDSALLRSSTPIPETTERDWLAELSNQLLGRLKNRLLAYEVEVAALTPTVLGSVRIVPNGPRNQRQGITMAAEGKRATVWIDYQVKDAQRLDKLARGDAEVGREGDLVLF